MRIVRWSVSSVDILASSFASVFKFPRDLTRYHPLSCGFRMGGLICHNLDPWWEAISLSSMRQWICQTAHSQSARDKPMLEPLGARSESRHSHHWVTVSLVCDAIPMLCAVNVKSNGGAYLVITYSTRGHKYAADFLRMKCAILMCFYSVLAGIWSFKNFFWIVECSAIGHYQTEEHSSLLPPPQPNPKEISSPRSNWLVIFHICCLFGLETRMIHSTPDRVHFSEFQVSSIFISSLPARLALRKIGSESRGKPPEA